MKQNYFVYIVTYRNQLEVAPLKNLFFLAVFFLTWRTLLDTTKKLKGWGKPSLQCKLGGWFWNGEVDTPLGTMQYYFYFNCTVVKNLFQQVFPDDLLTRFHIYICACVNRLDFVKRNYAKLFSISRQRWLYLKWQMDFGESSNIKLT